MLRLPNVEQFIFLCDSIQFLTQFRIQFVKCLDVFITRKSDGHIAYNKINYPIFPCVSYFANDSGYAKVWCLLKQRSNIARFPTEPVFIMYDWMKGHIKLSSITKASMRSPRDLAEVVFL